MKKSINNLEDLKDEIVRLRNAKLEQEVFLSNQYSLLKDKVDMPVRMFNSISSSIPGFGLLKDTFSSFSNLKSERINEGNMLQNVIRVGVPLLLNRTFLKKSNWFKKALILLLSDTATKQLTKENVNLLIEKVAAFVRPKNKKKKVLDEDRIEDQILGI